MSVLDSVLAFIEPLSAADAGAPPRPGVLANPQFWTYAFVFTPTLLFIALYGVFSRWRETSSGKGLMTLAVSMGAVLFNALLTIIFGADYAWRDVVRLGLLGGVGLAMWRLVWNLAKIQVESRRAGHQGPELYSRTDGPPPLPEETSR